METPKNILVSYRLKKGQIKMGFGSAKSGKVQTKVLTYHRHRVSSVEVA